MRRRTGLSQETRYPKAQAQIAMQVNLKIQTKNLNAVADNVANKSFFFRSIKLTFHFENRITGSSTFQAFPVNTH